MKKEHSGFTLVEVLMVVIVISILILMLFPVYGRIQERGRDVKCASNLRQLHTATMSYISNTGGNLPHSASARMWGRPNTQTPWQHSSWINGWVASYPMNTVNMTSLWWEAGASFGTYCITNGSIFPYLGDRGDETVYVCPTMLVEARRTYAATNVRSRVTRSYGMNNAVSGRRYHDIDGVSRIILFADQGFRNMGNAHCLTNAVNSSDNSGADPDNSWTETSYRQRYFRFMDGSIDYARDSNRHFDTQERIGELHGRRPGLNTGQANVIFLDGHVERVVYTNTVSVCTGAWEYGKPVP